MLLKSIGIVEVEAVNEVHELLERAATDLRHGWLEAAGDCLGRAVRILQALLVSQGVNP